ncbi:hypothetical protein GGS20DRAFT_376711 [Poronia punctata]|nr:hypothetical protein GGS20DRAFT_376711 [Poronia punctata]
MEALKQNIAEIESAIIEARQWLKEARTEADIDQRQRQLERLEADLETQLAKKDDMEQSGQGG